MRYSASEKYEIIRLVEESCLPIRQVLRYLDIGKSTFYNWLRRYQDDGVDGLEDKKPSTEASWNVKKVKTQMDWPGRKLWGFSTVSAVLNLPRGN